MRWATLAAFLLALAVLAISSRIHSQQEAAQEVQARMRALELQAAYQSIRQAILCYTVAKGKPPQSLDDLVEAGYLKGIPGDLIDAGYFKGMPRLGPIYTDPPVPPAPGHPMPASIPAS